MYAVLLKWKYLLGVQLVLRFPKQQALMFITAE